MRRDEVDAVVSRNVRLNMLPETFQRFSAPFQSLGGNFLVELFCDVVDGLRQRD